jgi:hypothetical protein
MTARFLNLYVIFSFVLIMVFACKNAKTPQISMPSPEYRLVKDSSLEIEELKKAYKKSKAKMDIDFDSGKFTASYEDIKLEGKYLIKSVKAGVSKGFVYETELDYLQNDVAQTKAQEGFIQNIVKCTFIYFSPNKLYNPSHFTFEIQNGENKLRFLKLNEF